MEFDVAVRCVEKWQLPKIKGPRNRPQYIMNLILGHPKKGPLILGSPQINKTCREISGESMRAVAAPRVGAEVGLGYVFYRLGFRV